MDVGEAVKDLLEGQPQLHLGDSRPQTFVHAVTKRNVFVYIVSVHIKCVRIGEDISVAVSGPVPKH